MSDLTPIKVRGKKRKLDTHSMLLHDQQRLLHHDARHSRASSQSSARSGTSSKRSRTTHRGPKTAQRTYSRLESLPVELIEQIFAECLEFSLPRASTILGNALASEIIYRGLILMAFWNDPLPDNDIVNGIIQSKLRPFHYTPMDLLERQALQWSVLSCRWCTHERVKGLMPEMARLSTYRWVSTASEAPWDHEEGKVTNDEEFEAMVDAVTHSNGTQLYHFRSILCLDNAFPQEFEWSLVVAVNAYPNQSPITTLAVPDKVLRGCPWTEEKMHYLKFLRKYITMLPQGVEFWSTFASRGVIQDGILSAILDRNPYVLRDLIELDDSCHHILDTQYDSFNPYKIPSDYFAIASRQYAMAIPLLRLLVRAAPLSVPYDDPELTEWALEACAKRHLFAIWLVKFMRDLPVILKRGNEMVFREGAAENVFPSYGMDFEKVFGTRSRPWTLELWQDVYIDADY